jgi:hypothetical protein
LLRRPSSTSSPVALSKMSASLQMRPAEPDQPVAGRRRDEVLHRRNARLGGEGATRRHAQPRRNIDGRFQASPGSRRRRLPRRNFASESPVADQRGELGLRTLMAAFRRPLQVLKRSFQILRDAEAGSSEQREKIRRVAVAFLRRGNLRDRLLIACDGAVTPLGKQLAIDRDPSHDRCDSSRAAPCARAC